MQNIFRSHKKIFKTLFCRPFWSSFIFMKITLLFADDSLGKGTPEKLNFKIIFSFFIMKFFRAWCTQPNFCCLISLFIYISTFFSILVPQTQFGYGVHGHEHHIQKTGNCALSRKKCALWVHTHIKFFRRWDNYAWSMRSINISSIGLLEQKINSFKVNKNSEWSYRLHL